VGLAPPPVWRHAAATIPTDAVRIDYLIGVPTLVGRGVGPEIIGHFVDDTCRQLPDASAIAVSVQQANQQSWRALEKAGFRRVWEGTRQIDDPSDAGPRYIYLRHHPTR